MQHIFNMKLEGKLHLAPIGDSPRRVLDVGTGTGSFSLAYSQNSQIDSTDLIQAYGRLTSPSKFKGGFPGR